MEDIITGRCKCGQVTYQGKGSTAAMFRCYCRDCQQLTGTGHSEMVPLLATTLRIDGPISEYQMSGGSGRPTWSGFCPNCGSPLTRRSDRMGDLVYVHAASLDDPSLYRPARNIYVDSAQPWDHPPDQPAVDPKGPSD